MVDYNIPFGVTRPDRRGRKPLNEIVACNHCGTLFTNKLIIHTNINQEIKVHIFCNKKCRDKYCYDLARKGGRK